MEKLANACVFNTWWRKEISAWVLLNKDKILGTKGSKMGFHTTPASSEILIVPTFVGNKSITASPPWNYCFIQVALVLKHLILHISISFHIFRYLLECIKCVKIQHVAQITFLQKLREPGKIELLLPTKPVPDSKHAQGWGNVITPPAWSPTPMCHPATSPCTRNHSTKERYKLKGEQGAKNMRVVRCSGVAPLSAPIAHATPHYALPPPLLSTNVAETSRQSLVVITKLALGIM